MIVRPLALALLLAPATSWAQPSPPTVPPPQYIGPGGPGAPMVPPPQYIGPGGPGAPMMRLDPLGLPAPDQLAAWLAAGTPRGDYAELVRGPHADPASPWLEHERQQFRGLVARARPELVVAPVQVQGYGIDRAMRAWMTAELVRATGARTAPATLVDRAMGEGRRRLNGQVGALAREAGARDVVDVYVGHDGQGRMLVTAVANRASDGSTRQMTARSWNDIALGEGASPIEAFRQAIPRIVEFIGRAPVRASGAPTALTDAPSSPGALARWAGASPSRRAAALAMLAALAPAEDDRTRQRLVVQALVELDRLATFDDDARFLRAWSLLRLDARPDAMRVLGDSAAPAFAALRDVANGNLSEAAASVAKVSAEVPRLLLELDLADLRWMYGIAADAGPSASVRAFTERRPGWAALVAMRLDDADAWRSGDALAVKRAFDASFPMPGVDAAAVARARSALGQPASEADLVVAAVDHGRRARADAKLDDCIAGAEACLPAALIDLLEARAVDAAVALLMRRAELQGLPDDARRFQAALDPTFAGHPRWLMAGARVQRATLRNASPAAQRAAEAGVLAAARAVARLEQGQTRLSRAALSLMATPTEDSIPFMQGYGRDLPPRPYWFPITWTMDPVVVTRERIESLAYSVADFAPVNDLARTADRPGPLADQAKRIVEATLRDRMHGHPSRTAMLSARAGAENPRAALEAVVRERPDDFAGYQRLASYDVQVAGDVASAERVLGSFPGFAPDARVANPVALSNQAAGAGHLFFWLGDVPRAQRFYRIATATRTGSDAEMLANARLALLEGRIADYGAQTLQRVQRYQSEYAIRDYLVFLFATERPRDAWAAFDRTVAEQRSPVTWQAAEVGHRLDRKDWNATRRWIAAEPQRSAGGPYAKLPMIHAIAVGSVDRTPSADLVTLVRELDAGRRPVTETTAGDTAVGVDANANQIVHRMRFREAERGAWKGDQQIPSYLVFFAEGLVALREGRDDAAVSHFDAMAGYYPIDGQNNHMGGVHTPMSIALPYFALAAGRTGDKLGLEAFVAALPPGQMQFDQHLALGVLKGLRKSRDDALPHLRKALLVRPINEWRPIPSEFQWAEACESLYVSTGDNAYRELALDWSRRFARIVPTATWAHAMVAKHSTDDAERVRAAGVVLALDPLSERLQSLPAAVRERAAAANLVASPFAPAPARTGAPGTRS